jgi:predicted nucleic acid-binding protein
MTLNYLLDTRVISEFVKPKPARQVLDWLNSVESDRVFLSAVTVGEIQAGISNQQNANRRTELEEWLNVELATQFVNRILPLDEAVFKTWGQMTARLKQTGKPMSVMDSLIAATALHHSMILVSRNLADFEHAGLSLFNPWQ